MTSRDFCYWLQGFFELKPSQAGLSPRQIKMIRKHLDLVFAHEIDPDTDKGDPVLRKQLDAIHGSTGGGSASNPIIRC